jgi:hypothetical protein
MRNDKAIFEQLEHLIPTLRGTSRTADRRQFLVKRYYALELYSTKYPLQSKSNCT